MNNQQQLKQYMKTYDLTPSEVADSDLLDVSEVIVRRWLAKPDTPFYSAMPDNKLRFLGLLLQSRKRVNK